MKVGRILDKLRVPIDALVSRQPSPASIATENDFQRYFVHGHLRLPFRPSPTLDTLFAVLSELESGTLRDGFSWEEKYRHTQDLRPRAVDYDPVFLDILADQGIPQLVKEATGFDLVLGHVQLRMAYPGSSYMDWHRDTHVHGGTLTGNLPPVHKVIVYPTGGRQSEPRLRMLSGSHHSIFSTRVQDRLRTRIGRAQEIGSSDHHFLLFNTGLLHAVVPEANPGGSLRLIYSITHKFQSAADSHTADLQSAFESRSNAG